MTLLMLLFSFNSIAGAINVCIIMLGAYLIMSESGTYIRVAFRAALNAAKRTLNMRRL